MSLTLYYHPLASFCHKTLIALYELALPFEKRLIDLGNAADRAELEALWPFGTFPVIRDHARKRTVAESTIINEYLDHHAGGGRLLPADWEDALRVREWERFCDNQLQLPMQAIVADRIHGARADLSRERAKIRTAYTLFDAQLATTPWAACATFSMADCAAAPALFYASTLEAFPREHEHLIAYFDRLVARPCVERVLDEARAYFHFYPFAEAIPQRFL
ncbi:MAG: glutathione S-transferase family protein [Rudaea sp.]